MVMAFVTIYSCMMCLPYFGLSGDQSLQPVFLWRDPRQPLCTGKYVVYTIQCIHYNKYKIMYMCGVILQMSLCGSSCGSQTLCPLWLPLHH